MSAGCPVKGVKLMILDNGICSIFSVTNTGAAGNMPVESLALKYQSWYGELGFETAPIYATEAQEDIEVSTRIRVVGNREINNHDRLIFTANLTPPAGATQYEITRVYHGTDQECGQPISDLTLRLVKQS